MPLAKIWNTALEWVKLHLGIAYLSIFFYCHVQDSKVSMISIFTKETYRA